MALAQASISQVPRLGCTTSVRNKTALCCNQASLCLFSQLPRPAFSHTLHASSKQSKFGGYPDKQHFRGARIRAAPVSGATEGPEDEEGRSEPKTASELEKMRAELEALQTELDETRSKANAARDRFMRLTSAVEKKRAAAEKAVRAGDEASARKLLHEKNSVLQALEKSQQRAEVLQALATQLGKVMSRKETLYIAALSSVQRAAEATKAAPKVTIIEAPPSLEREEAVAHDVAALADELDAPDKLDKKFLDMERSTLERMFTQSPSADADRRSSGDPSTSSGSVDPDLRPTADLYKQEVKRQIAEVELKLAVLESDRAERMDGRDLMAEGNAAGSTVQALDEKIKKAREVLARLRMVQFKIQDGAFETSYDHTSDGKKAPWPEIKVAEQQSTARVEWKQPEREPSKRVLRALDYLRQKDQVGAAALLQQWLSEEPTEGWTWDRLAGDQGSEAITGGERADLYYAYLRHVLVPEATAEPLEDSTASYLGAAASRVLNPPKTINPARLQTLRSFLGLSANARDAAHREAFREALTSAALESREWELPGYERLLAELALPGHVAAEERARAEAVGRYRRLVGTLLRNLQETRGDAKGRSIDWELSEEHTRELATWRDQLALPSLAARTAAAAACRTVLQEMLQSVLDVQRRTGGLVAPVAAELDNLVRFAREAAFPALEIAASAEASESAVGATGNASESVVGASETSTAASETPLRASVATRRGQVSGRELRLLVFGGDAETLLSTHFENGYKQTAAQAMTSPEGGADGQAARDSEAATNADVLAELLGVSAPVAGALRRAAAASAYAELAKRAVAEAYISHEARGQLDRARAALGLGADEAKRCEQEAAAVRIGAEAKRLLDKRARGRDVTSAEVRQLASMCENLQVVRVAQVDSRDALVLYRRAAQTVLEEGSARAVNPGQLVLEGKALLRRVASSFGVSDADVQEVLTSLMDTAAKAALVQARASLRRGDPSLAADDVTRLAVALIYKPEADIAKGALPESEARDLYSLYSSRHGRARDVGPGRSELSVLQEEMLRRLAKYLGLL